MQHPINNWSEVVAAVINADKNINKNSIQTIRKLTYRNALQKQIQQHNRQVEHEKNKKIKQKNLIQSEILNDEAKYVTNKINKVSKEQWYQLQNLQLIKFKRKQRQHESKTPDISNNQFFKLEDGERQRKLATRRNFQLQNSLNDKQSQIKIKTKSRQRDINMHEKQLFNEYVEHQYYKQQSDRQLWRNKYLLGKSNKDLQQNQNYKLVYRAYLKNQMEQRQKKHYFQKQKIDEKIKKINQSVDKMDSSPAYLGVGTQSFDRKKQLSLIDKHLQFDQKYVRERLSINNKREPQTSQSKLKRVQISQPELYYKKQSISQIRQKQRPKQSQRYSYSQQDKKQRQFTSYDFITGTHKTFFA